MLTENKNLNLVCPYCWIKLERHQICELIDYECRNRACFGFEFYPNDWINKKESHTIVTIEQMSFYYTYARIGDMRIELDVIDDLEKYCI
jgi:hypothetical protein